MTNEQKATELGIKYQTPCHGFGDCEFEARQSALEMAEWKEKYMMADIRAWLRDICRVCDITDEHGYPIDEHALFASFEKSLKGGEK